MSNRIYFKEFEEFRLALDPITGEEIEIYGEWVCDNPNVDVYVLGYKSLSGEYKSRVEIVYHVDGDSLVWRQSFSDINGEDAAEQAIDHLNSGKTGILLKKTEGTTNCYEPVR